MIKKEWKITGQFKARSKDGKEFKIIERTIFFTIPKFQSRPELKPGIKSYSTTNGMHVNVINEDKGIYEMLDIGITIYKN